MLVARQTCRLAGLGLMSSPESRSRTDEEPLLGQALDLMARALNLLDEGNAPAEIGCHLDLAICRLADALGRARPDAGSAQPTD